MFTGIIEEIGKVNRISKGSESAVIEINASKIMDDVKLKEFGKDVAYGYWERYDAEHSVIRIATSWATTEASVETLISLL